MKKTMFVLLLVVLLLSLAMPVIAMAGMGEDDPCPPGYVNNGNPKCWDVPPPGLQNNHNGNAGLNWVVPAPEGAFISLLPPGWAKALGFR